MEWRAGKNSKIRSVIVPDELFVETLDILQATGVAIDPYRDQELGNESIRLVLETLKKSWGEQVARVEVEVKQKLGVWELSGWALKMVQARIKQNKLMNTCHELIGLCEYALAHDVNIEILGQ